MHCKVCKAQYTLLLVVLNNHNRLYLVHRYVHEYKPLYSSLVTAIWRRCTVHNHIPLNLLHKKVHKKKTVYTKEPQSSLLSALLGCTMHLHTKWKCATTQQCSTSFSFSINRIWKYTISSAAKTKMNAWNWNIFIRLRNPHIWVYSLVWGFAAFLLPNFTERHHMHIFVGWILFVDISYCCVNFELLCILLCECFHCVNKATSKC